MYAILGRSHLLLLLMLLVLVVLPNLCEAVAITSVTAPDLKRPKDDAFYPFRISVDGTYGTADGAVNMSVGYWDRDIFIIDLLDPDDPIELRTTLMLPELAAGNLGVAFSRILEFDVGCTKGGKVNGPSSGGGTTGENPMTDGYFRFENVSLGRNWGFNKVDCIEAGGNPIAENAHELRKLSESIDPRQVGEPATVFLVLAGFAAATLIRREWFR